MSCIFHKVGSVGCLDLLQTWTHISNENFPRCCIIYGSCSQSVISVPSAALSMAWLIFDSQDLPQSWTNEKFHIHHSKDSLINWRRTRRVGSSVDITNQRLNNKQTNMKFKLDKQDHRFPWLTSFDEVSRISLTSSHSANHSVFPNCSIDLYLWRKRFNFPSIQSHQTQN